MKKLCTIALLMLSTTLSAQVDIPDPEFLDALLYHSPVIDTDNNGEISIAEAEALTGTLNVLEEGITDMTGLEAFVNITALNCDYNEITTLDISNNLLLNSISCTGNNLTTMDLSDWVMTGEVNLSANQLSSLTIDNAVFGNLNLSNNNLTDVDFSGVSFVDTDVWFSFLDLSSNQFTELDLSETNNIYFFTCSYNPDLTFVNLHNGYEEIYDDSFTGLDNLEAICLDSFDEDLVAQISYDFEEEVVITDDCNIDVNIYNEISGNISFDIDDNGCSPGLDVPSVVIMSTDGVSTYATVSSSDSDYLLKLYTNNGDFSTTLLGLPDYFTVNPSPSISSFTGFGNAETIDFCLTAEEDVNDVNVVLMAADIVNPGFEVSYVLVYKNHGNTVMSGDITLDFDGDVLDLISASETIVTETENALSFAYADMNPFETRTINIEFQALAPPVLEIGDAVDYTVAITPVSGDNTPDNNVYELQQIATGSYDPNDIRVMEGDFVAIADAGEYLHYMIRFQNTGTAPAVTVRVENELDDLLDWDTFEYLTSSHDNRVEIIDGNEISFIFEEIDLIDSLTDAAGSQGFIAYRIKPISDIAIGDIIENQAAIYFDFNLPVITNIATTEIVQFVPTVSVSELSALDYTIYPVPTTTILNINAHTAIAQIEVMNELGQLLILEKNAKRIDVSALPQGLYFVKVTDANGNSGIQKVIKQ